jgi:hypothetical protein
MVCGIIQDNVPGSQTERPGAVGPMGELPGGDTSPAAAQSAIFDAKTALWSPHEMAEKTRTANRYRRNGAGRADRAPGRCWAGDAVAWRRWLTDRSSRRVADPHTQQCQRPFGGTGSCTCQIIVRKWGYWAVTIFCLFS